jgi:hypothetical protein
MIILQLLIMVLFILCIISLPLFIIFKKTRKIIKYNLIIICFYVLSVNFPIIPYYNKGFIISIKDKSNHSLQDIDVTVIRNRYYLNTSYCLPLIDPVETKQYVIGNLTTDKFGHAEVGGNFIFLKLFELNHEGYIIFSNIKHNDLKKVNIYELENNKEVIFPNMKYYGNILITSSIKNNDEVFKKYYIKWVDEHIFYNKLFIILYDTADNRR